jgi:predicted transcriptional regulator
MGTMEKSLQLAFIEHGLATCDAGELISKEQMVASRTAKTHL